MSTNDVESFLKKWWSLNNLGYRQELREWMANSYCNPSSFWEGLFSYSLQIIRNSSQSHIFQKYDFYFDCIVRHLGMNKEAFRWINQEGQTESWTYEQIDAMVDVQGAIWQSTFAMKPGQTVALIMPYGIHFIVALMTSLRLGLIHAILPMDDRFFSPSLLQHALNKIDPDLVVLSGYNMPLEKWDVHEIDLSLQNEGRAHIESYIYSAEEMVQKQFNPDIPEAITMIEATRSYLVPLRDALIALKLNPAMKWARPFASMYLEEPQSTIMAFLVGLTIVGISENYLKTHSDAFKNESIDVLGVNPRLLTHWIKNPGAPANKLKFWYRTPLYGNHQSWKAFAELNQLPKIPTCQLIIEKEHGGITLFSQPELVETITFFHPSLGTPWKLLKINGKGEESTEGIGLFSVDAPVIKKPHMIMMQVGDEWSLSHTSASLKEGFPYPISRVEECVKTVGFVQTCMIVPDRHPEHYMNKQINLLIFIAPKNKLSIPKQEKEWMQEIQDKIQKEVGEAFIPDNIIFYSMFPKLIKGNPHRKWIESQYQSGSLAYKQKRSIYHTLNLIRQSIYETIAYNAEQK